MLLRPAALLFFITSSLAQAVEIRVATFNIGAHLVVPPGGGPAYFDYGLGESGTPDHDSVRGILGRIDADVVALQEIHTADVNGNDVADLAASLGYPHFYIAPTTNVFDPSLRVAFLSRFPFLTQNSIGPPGAAKDVTRRMPMVKVDVPGTTRDPVLLAAHLKSGSAASDIFQRTVEMRRLTDSLSAQGLTSNDNFIVMGDFNLSNSDRTFTALPTSGLPSGFILGADIVFPQSYHTNPLSYFTAPSVNRIIPRQLDNSTTTFPSSGSTIDLFLVSPIISARPLRTEIYNSALDVSNSIGLPKSGNPPATGTSATASDHFPLFGDFELDAAAPYAFTQPGQTVNESFDGFSGTYDPYPWETTGGTWKGTDTGDSATGGFRSYGSAGDPSLGFLPAAAGGSATAFLANQSTQVLSALQISLTAEQWRSATAGAADSLSAELIVGGVPRPLPPLTYQASTSLPGGAIAGGTSQLVEATVGGLSIAPGETFQLRFSFNSGPGTGPPPNDVFVNEFHYDNTGTDEGEFIEVVVGPGFTGQLSDIDVLLYRSTNGTVYNTLNMGSAAFSLENTINGFRILLANLPVNGLQNGSSGIAVVNKTSQKLLHFLSYEGAFSATAGLPSGAPTGSSDIGVSQSGSEAVGQDALGLGGTGGVRSDFEWTKISGAYSKGLPNAGQTLATPALPSQGIAIDNLAVTFLTGGDTDGDGFSDADEIVFGTNPADAGSRFVVNFANQTPAPGMVRLSFPTLTGREYVVESSTDFSDWEDEAIYPGTGMPQVADFPVFPNEPKRFYRIRATLQ
jgi:endonuclease/exonuclease/phosphatase family metal-dependent hydrolase